VDLQQIHLTQADEHRRYRLRRATLDCMSGLRQRCHRYSTRLYGPSRDSTRLSWIGDQRIAIGCLPTAAALPRLLDDGVTHIVNCRSTAQTWVSQDLAVERALLGPSRVVHAPMWDSGHPQPPRLWSAAARFAAQVLTDDPAARVLIHCHQGRRRSIMVAYAVLRLRGHGPDEAVKLISTHRAEAQIVDAYTASVEQWLASGADPVGRLRTGRAATRPRA
jgi:protein-tyrosine phosphatase